MNQRNNIVAEILSAWRFLQVGLYIDVYMQDNSEIVKQSCKNITLNGFTFDKDYISAFIPKKTDSFTGHTYFGSHVFHFSLKGIFSAIYEGLNVGDKNEKLLKFRTYVTKLLGKNTFYDFSKIIELCRHVYVHNLTKLFAIRLIHIKKLIDNINKYRPDGTVSLNLNIKEIFQGSNPKTSTLDIGINFNELTEKQLLYDVINPHDMMGLVEFCGLIAERYAQTRINSLIGKANKSFNRTG